MGFSPLRLVKAYGETIYAVRFPLITIAAMLAIGTLTRYSGIDATLGLAFAHTGFFYPFFGTLLGWLGVALTGSDTASNVLFGGLQKITAEQLGISPVLMAAATPVETRTGEVGNLDAMMKAKQPAWVAVANPFLGLAGVLLGARLRGPTAVK